MGGFCCYDNELIIKINKIEMKTLASKALILSVIVILSSAFTVELLPTKLQVTVRNTLGNVEPEVRIELYETEEDYKNEENIVQEAVYTDKKGRVVFKDLEEKTYFINAVKGDMNNYGMGVQTGKLEKGKVNKVTIVIE